MKHFFFLKSNENTNKFCVTSFSFFAPILENQIISLFNKPQPIFVKMFSYAYFTLFLTTKLFILDHFCLCDLKIIFCF